MKFGAFEVEQASAKKDIRSYLNECAYVMELDGKTVACATDGHILAVVPVTMEEGDTPGYVQADALKKARKLGSVKANGALTFPDGSSCPRDAKDGMKFPEVERVIPKAETLQALELHFDAELLYRLAKAVSPKSSRGARPITLRIAIDNPELNTILVEGQDGAFGVLMPMRK